MKEQIEEMAKDLCQAELWDVDEDCCDLELDRRKTAENLYATGYRKQEWISVEERLPENEQMVLTIDTVGEIQVCFYETAWKGIFQKFHGLVKIYNITHWMPLPEPPKMKGGAE